MEALLAIPLTGKKSHPAGTKPYRAVYAVEALSACYCAYIILSIVKYQLLPIQSMRIDDVEIEGPSDDLPWSGKEKAAYGKRSLANILEEVESQQHTSASTYNRIPIESRAPAIKLP